MCRCSCGCSGSTKTGPFFQGFPQVSNESSRLLEHPIDVGGAGRHDVVVEHAKFTSGDFQPAEQPLDRQLGALRQAFHSVDDLIARVVVNPAS